LKRGCLISLDSLFFVAPTGEPVGYFFSGSPTIKTVGSNFATSIEPTALVVGALFRRFLNFTETHDIQKLQYPGIRSFFSLFYNTHKFNSLPDI
jgi:hypothetical protein